MNIAQMLRDIVYKANEAERYYKAGNLEEAFQLVLNVYASAGLVTDEIDREMSEDED